MKIHKLQKGMWMRSVCWKFRGGVQEWDKVNCALCLKHKPWPEDRVAAPPRAAGERNKI